MWLGVSLVPVQCSAFLLQKIALSPRSQVTDQVLEARGDEEIPVFDDPDVARPEILKVVGAFSQYASYYRNTIQFKGKNAFNSYRVQIGSGCVATCSEHYSRRPPQGLPVV